MNTYLNKMDIFTQGNMNQNIIHKMNFELEELSMIFDNTINRERNIDYSYVAIPRKMALHIKINELRSYKHRNRYCSLIME